MLPLADVLSNQPAPVERQLVGRRPVLEHHAAARRARHKAQPHLGIVAQRLIVADADRRGRNRLPVHHLRRLKRDMVAEAALQHTPQHLGLHRAHDAHREASLLRAHEKQRILLLQLAQVSQQLSALQPLRRLHVHAHQRHERLRLASHVRADVLARPAGQARHHRRLPGEKLRDDRQARALRLIEGVDLLRARARGHRFPGAQTAGQRLHIAIAHAVPVRHAVNFGRKRCIQPRGIVRLRQRRNRLHQRIHAHVHQRAAAEHGIKHAGPHRPARTREIVRALRGFLQVPLHEQLVARSQLLAQQFRVLCHEHAVARQQPLHLRHHARNVRALAVGLVQKDDRRNPLVPEQAHQRHRVALHALRAGDDQHRHVQHGQRALHLAGKIDVAGRVHQRDAHRLPILTRQIEGRLLAEDRDAARTLERMSVHERVAVVHAASPAQQAAAHKQLLAQRRLARVHMGQHAQAKGNPFRRLPAHENAPSRSIIRELYHKRGQSSRRCGRPVDELFIEFY